MMNVNCEKKVKVNKQTNEQKKAKEKRVRCILFLYFK